jgi:23S rRNA (uridine2552-2'-O)-methyltransferase
MAKPYDPKDRFFQKAKDQGFRARSAFKIEEILRRQKLLGKGGSVLDLGAAPGGFLQILAEVVGPRGVAVGVDIVPIQRLAQPWVKTAVLDLLAPEALERIQELHPGRFDLVTSDMAPKTIGVKITDEARSLELSRMALSVAGDTLKLGGAFVVKVFIQKEMRARFGKVDVVRPEATRERSFEVYVVGSDFKPPPSGGGTVALR